MKPTARTTRREMTRIPFAGQWREATPSAPLNFGQPTSFLTPTYPSELKLKNLLGWFCTYRLLFLLLKSVNLVSIVIIAYITSSQPRPLPLGSRPSVYCYYHPSPPPSTSATLDDCIETFWLILLAAVVNRPRPLHFLGMVLPFFLQFLGHIPF
ncbi:hypothetical protein B0T24DRAFT_184948 [Lasiosphaeria ovina]|uniref:Uncharacterized protein n=1 Tax=Lasiosphaeria ovina TaxID=92902 RepID=A0AAE0TU82_9PEZI|nr:hypothetical protein B0T24DRAFT_184948 [Lasiosphaeria ovina]